MARTGTPPPPRSGMTPQQYFAELYSQGYGAQQAYQAVQQQFGPPPTRQQQEQQNAKNEQIGAIAGTIGTLGGLIGGKLVYDWAKNTWFTDTGKEVTKDTAKQIFAAQGVPYTQSGVLTITRPIPGITTVADGSAGMVDLGGPTVTVDTPAGPQAVPEAIANDQGFMSSVDWNAVGTGATTLLAAYNAYKSAQDKDWAGTGIYGTTAGLGALSLAGGAGSETAGALLPFAGGIAGGYGALKTGQMVADTAAGASRNKQAALGGAGAGAMIGSAILPGVGTAIGAGIGALIGAGSSWFGSGKGEGQRQRDQVRASMQDAGLLDKKWQGTLADGSLFDFGVDGKPFSWREFDKKIVDTPSYNKTVALTDAMVTGMGLSGMSRSNINLLFSRAAQSNAGDDYDVAKNNVMHFANQLGITSDIIKTNTQQQFDNGDISQSQYDTYMSLANEFPGATSAPTPVKNAAIPIRPPKGEVIRISPGVYRTDTGNVVRAKTMRNALEEAYGKTKQEQDKEL